MTPDETPAVRDLLARYAAALNASDTAAVLPLYSDDGVFMAPYGPSAVGPAALRQAYDAVFNAIQLSVKFEIAEVVQVAADWAFARTNSAGTVLVHASGARVPEANQELFLFRKGTDGQWRIARYGFSSTNPPPGA